MQVKLEMKYKNLAKTAINKKAAYGTDIDLYKYEDAAELDGLNNLDVLPTENKRSRIVSRC